MKSWLPKGLHNRHVPGSPSGDLRREIMLLFRWLVLLLLLGAGVCFAFYAGTGQERFRRYGLLTLKWTVLCGLGFFAVLVLERLA